MDVYVDGIGLRGPGLDDWRQGSAVLGGLSPFMEAPVTLPPPDLLPPTERRRTVPTVRLALLVGIEALTNADCDPKSTATVFTSSGGDGETVHSILEVLASPLREVSPTRFHNSVHNAPSGYWNIAVNSHEPTTSLCGYDSSFAVGLLDAAAQSVVDARPVALIAYDLPYPAPLARVRTIGSTFGVALVLSPQRTGRSVARLTLSVAEGRRRTAMPDPGLESLRQGNPAGRSLPVLSALALGSAETVEVEYLDGLSLSVIVAPV